MQLIFAVKNLLCELAIQVGPMKDLFRGDQNQRMHSSHLPWVPSEPLQIPILRDIHRGRLEGICNLYNFFWNIKIQLINCK